MTIAPSTDVAFTPSVKAIQESRGSRAMLRRLEERGGWRTTVTPDLEAFLAERDSVYLGTASAVGRPYIQHRGGPKGFIRIVDDRTLGFVDYAGNRQYITTGNLAENPQAFLFLPDYANQRRIKIWGRARVVRGDEELTQRLMPGGYHADPEQVILFEIEAWSINCRQHIPQKIDAADVEAALGNAQRRIAELEAEVTALRAGLGTSRKEDR
jgi:uncharacterized protein